MSRKTSRRKAKRKVKTKKPQNARNIIIGFLILLLILLGFGLLKSSKGYNVLGISTLLTKGGDDGGGSGGGGGDDHGSSSGGGGSSSSDGGHGGSGGGSSGQGSDTPQLSGFTRTSSSNPSAASNVGESTHVDCVGPDGKTFKASFHDCQELNAKWGKSSFQFRETKTEQPCLPQNPPVSQFPQRISELEHGVETEVKHLENEVPKELKRLEVETSDKTKIDLRQNGIRIRIEKEGGKTKIKIKKADGTEIELEQKTLDDVNHKLENENEAEVETASGSSNLLVRHNGVEATTEHPLERNLAKNTITIETPNGTKTLEVLPDQAVQGAIVRNFLTEVSSSDSAGFAHIKLTIHGNDPVFEVQGIKKEKLFGLLPVLLHKRVDVSATSGNVVGTQESFFTNLLDALSF